MKTQRFVFGSVLLTAATTVTAQAPTVTIDSGVYIGTTAVLPTATSAVNQFLGIPFAAQPERFAPAQAAPFSAGVKQATARGPACFQQFNYPELTRNFTMAVFNPTNPPESEDCLQLNVFAPAAPAPVGGRTVMLWYYGGGLQFGYSGLPTYDGTSFAANQDVVLVATNYRMNVFGFPGNVTGLAVNERNVGFLDQRLALDWVKRNIAKFGGDPAKVTIFGESAGAASVDLLVKTADYGAPFRAAILESGSAQLTSTEGSAFGGGAPLPAGETSFDALAQGLNCTGTDTLECVRAAPAAAVKSVIEHQALVFQPVPDNGTTVPNNADVARASLSTPRIPIMLGSNAQEGRIFVVGQNNLTLFLNGLFPGDAFAATRAQVQAAYPIGPNTLFKGDYDAIAQVLTDFAFGCIAASEARKYALTGYPTWRYFFNASFANTQLVPGLDLGVYHSSEIFQVFGTYPNGIPGFAPPTQQEIDLSKNMQKYWADFAKNPLTGPGWNRIGTGFGADLGDLPGMVNGTAVGNVFEIAADSKCGIYQPLYDLAALAGGVGGSR